MTPARRQTHNSNKYDRQVSGVGTLHHCNCHLLYCTLHYCGYCLPLNDNMSFISQTVRRRQCHLSTSLIVSSCQCPRMMRVCQTLESRGGEVLAVCVQRLEAFSLHHQLLLTGGLGTNGRRGWSCDDQSEARLHMEHMFTLDTSPACSLHCDQGASVSVRAYVS